MSDEDPLGKVMNGIQKYVVSTTLDKAGTLENKAM